MLILCLSTDACMLLFNANFSMCKLIIDLKFYKKEQDPFFIVNVFFLKQVFSALMIVCGSSLLLQYRLFFVYLYFQQICLCRFNTLIEGKIMSALYFLFILFHLF